MSLSASAFGIPAGANAIPITVDTERRTREAEIVRRAQEGDLVAFEQLYRENVRRVFAVCLRVCSDASLAEELTQDAFVRAWEKLGSFRGESAFFSWLYPLVVNLALGERRSRFRRSARVFATDDLETYDRPETAPDPVRSLDLERALATLPPGARAVFVLHDVEGRQHQEIAKMTGIAVGTSKAQLHRARRLLREVLQS